ncbi:AfsR/SARP family transcriptional regulator [Streptomyces pini]|uniref:DNA-binding transcriptional activator of the SARP family n=1 Tax=Streptomyces pini TaxID=1520580 RepID=A0A1I3ZMA9_9ACTN|nr:AfsR/SARP family transcriptional regulator [Streptomyces pini]SFK44689.1 DNA-binding transcriptional activator of the SARP family [Streptomyces pini]
MLNFSILGALEIRTPGGQVEIPGDLQRTLVQVLLAGEGRHLSGETLVEEVWGSAPPGNQTNALQAHISRIRRRLRALEPERRPSRLVTNPAGYRLVVEDGELDAANFVRDVQRAEEMLLSDPAGASRLLRSALAMWRGPVFGDLPGGPMCRMVAVRYEEHRLWAMELYFDAELSLGRHKGILAQLRETHIDHPLRERFCEQLMVALYRSGRQVDALATYRNMWKRLSEELGVQPSPSLRRVEHAILSHDPVLTAADATLRQ